MIQSLQDLDKYLQNIVKIVELSTIMILLKNLTDIHRFI